MLVTCDIYAKYQYPCFNRYENKWKLGSTITFFVLSILCFAYAFSNGIPINFPIDTFASLRVFCFWAGAGCLAAGVIALIAIKCLAGAKIGSRIQRMQETACPLSSEKRRKVENRLLLPKFIYLEILQYLSDKDLCAFGSACTDYHRLMHEALIVQDCVEFKTDDAKSVAFIGNDYLITNASESRIRIWEGQKGEQSHFKLVKVYRDIARVLSCVDNVLIFKQDNRIHAYNILQEEFLPGGLDFTNINFIGATRYGGNSVLISDDDTHSIVIWEHEKKTRKSAALPFGTFKAFTIVNDRWIVGTRNYVDLEKQLVFQTEKLPATYTRCAYKDFVIYLSEQDNSVYMNKMPELNNAICLSSGWDKETVMFTHHDHLYLQKPDGIVHRYHFESHKWRVVLRLSKYWRMKEIVGQYLIAHHEKESKVRSIKL